MRAVDDDDPGDATDGDRGDCGRPRWSDESCREHRHGEEPEGDRQPMNERPAVTGAGAERLQSLVRLRDGSTRLDRLSDELSPDVDAKVQERRAQDRTPLVVHPAA